ncbi:Cytoskeleton protein RodZ [Sporomusa rhizae]|uniref:helix-turn-helix domain-containing protein n=1 Tax=Sporomusa rhizae TaxID=357999 RepID=UPI00352AFFE1
MQTVGELLRAERLKKDLSIKDVENAISIRALYLNAIEEGNYGIIPGEVYLKGFIRNYATFLGLDAQQVMDIYRQSKVQTTEDAPPPAIQEEPVAATSQKSGNALKWLGVVVVAAGIVAGLVWWSNGSEKPAPVPPQSTAQQQPEQPKQPMQQQTPPQTPTNQSVAPTKTANKVVVTAKYNSQCWTQIIADGKEIYEGTPKSGEALTWEASNKLVAKFGNAGAVDLTYNSSPVGKIGGNGDVVVKTFTLTGVAQ